MTTIAVNSTMIACDLQATYGEATKMKIAHKIFKVPAQNIFQCEYAYIGFCGGVARLGEIIHWFQTQNEEPPKVKNMEYLALTCEGDIYGANNLMNWMLIPGPFHAIGSGMQFAIAAMESGKTPYEAVKVASKFDPFTGMGFKKYELKN